MTHEMTKAAFDKIATGLREAIRRDKPAKFVKRIAYEEENDRPGLKDAVDEIVTGPLDGFHIERMDDGTYWMGLYKGSQRQVIVVHGTNPRTKIVARTERDE